ncbi:MAG TPA: efflux RND transporter permease subunit [Deltaproteobacteria bacterium]|nr:efflux RND transporter permease subunit [Deltaproteobacteria bacterium]HPR51490.1 efflux RND transporter permease subunit [Deltaproteobacteria bacterium]
MKIADFSISKPVTTITVTAAIIIFGYIAFTGMGIDLFPEVDIPVVTVSTILEGASPEVIDSDVTDVIEEQVKTISGIKNITSQSYEGYSQIVVEFELEKDGDIGAQEVRAKVNLAERDLPEDAEKPVVDKFDLNSQAFMWISVSGDVDYGELTHYADKVLKEQLQSIGGVGNVQVGGMRDRQIRVWIDPQKLKARGLTAQDVVGAIKTKHLELPGGRIETHEKEYSIKVKGEYVSADDLRELVVAQRQGSPVRLSDIGRVDDGFEDFRSIARFNGSPTVGLGIRKQSGSNTTSVAHAVKARLADIAANPPEGIKIQLAYDGSGFIEDSMKGVRFDILFGIILTALTMYLFLRNIRITFIAIIAIPVSLIGAFIVMQALGFTINNLTMLAMSLAVGMVIDDAIVVLENIFRHIEGGEDRLKAASTGTQEVGLAVIAATSSIAAVFIPVAFMKGIIGRFFYQFGLTVALTITISVLVSLTLTPFLCSRMMKHQASHNRIYVILENALLSLEKGYRSVLTWALSHRKSIIGIAIAAFIGGISLAPMIGSEFVTESDEGNFLVRFELPTGTSIEQTDLRMHEMEQYLYSQKEVHHSFSAIGLGSAKEVNNGMFLVGLVDKHDRDASQREIMNRVRERFSTYEDSIISVEPLSRAGGGSRNSDIQIVIKGPNLDELVVVSKRIVDDLKSQGVFMDVDTNLRITKPDIKVNINRDLADDLGVDVRSISNEIYTLFGGTDAAKFKDGGNRYDIRVKALPEYRMSPDNLDLINVRAPNGQLIDAANLINYEEGMGPNVINRYNRMRSVSLYANVKDIPEGEGLARTLATVHKYVPQGGNWDIELSGNSQNMQESFGYLMHALMIAILIIYMILCIQFESFLHPFTMMLSLPLSMVGVFGALLASGMTLNIFSFIGIIMLMGIVTKNGILLVDFANQQRDKGLDKVNAIINAGAVRLRPILMTALAVIVSVIPVALALSDGGETRAPMGMAVIGGMVSSTLLTLIVVPVVYIMLDNAKEKITGWLNKPEKAAVSIDAKENPHG